MSEATLKRENQRLRAEVKSWKNHARFYFWLCIINAALYIAQLVIPW
jgi:hypothetical protein